VTRLTRTEVTLGDYQSLWVESELKTRWSAALRDPNADQAQLSSLSGCKCEEHDNKQPDPSHELNVSCLAEQSISRWLVCLRTNGDLQLTDGFANASASLPFLDTRGNHQRECSAQNTKQVDLAPVCHICFDARGAEGVRDGTGGALMQQSRLEYASSCASECLVTINRPRGARTLRSRLHRNDGRCRFSKTQQALGLRVSHPKRFAARTGRR